MAEVRFSPLKPWNIRFTSLLPHAGKRGSSIVLDVSANFRPHLEDARLRMLVTNKILSTRRTRSASSRTAPRAPTTRSPAPTITTATSTRTEPTPAPRANARSPAQRRVRARDGRGGFLRLAHSRRLLRRPALRQAQVGEARAAHHRRHLAVQRVRRGDRSHLCRGGGARRED